MRGSLNILFFLLLVSCRAQEQRTAEAFRIDKHSKDSFYFAKTLLDTTDGDDFIMDGHTAILVPERMGDEEDMSDGVNKGGFVLPCQCAYKNDTLLVVSGLAWEGGFAYVAKAYEERSKNFLMLFGKKRKWKLGNKEFVEEIEIPSASDRLVISKSFPLKLDDQLYGWFELNTPEFYELSGAGGDTKPQRHIVKIYFSCLVYPEIL